MTFLRNLAGPGLVIAMCAAGPFAANAAGGNDSSPPPQTETTTTCQKGEVWDKKTKTCIKAESNNLTDDQRFEAARELAYVGRPEEALAMLAVMTEGDSDRVLTYKGFANRKAGRMDQGMKIYRAALRQNPDNLLARSYMGQGYVEMGNLVEAKVQLAEIVQRGGSGTWAEDSLHDAILTGHTYGY